VRIDAQSTISDHATTLVWREVGKGVIEVDAADYGGKQRFVRVSARGAFPTVLEQCAN
jgi:hypothetical protein